MGGKKLDSAESDLRACIERFSPDIAQRGTSALARMRSLLPSALQLVYDNYNALVIGFSPTERASEAVISIVLYPRKVVLCFLWGAELPDPDNVLRGSGTRARTLRLDSLELLDEPSVRLLIDQAASRANWTLSANEAARTIIKSVSERQRPR
jgi:hypothetical protein